MTWKGFRHRYTGSALPRYAGQPDLFEVAALVNALERTGLAPRQPNPNTTVLQTVHSVMLGALLMSQVLHCFPTLKKLFTGEEKSR